MRYSDSGFFFYNYKSSIYSGKYGHIMYHELCGIWLSLQIWSTVSQFWQRLTKTILPSFVNFMVVPPRVCYKNMIIRRGHWFEITRLLYLEAGTEKCWQNIPCRYFSVPAFQAYLCYTSYRNYGILSHFDTFVFRREGIFFVKVTQEGVTKQMSPRFFQYSSGFPGFLGSIFQNRPTWMSNPQKSKNSKKPLS